MCKTFTIFKKQEILECKEINERLLKLIMVIEEANYAIEIDKAIEYLYAAVEIENRGIYFYFISYIVYDHHFRKGYYIDPNYKYFFNIARQNGVSQNDVKELFGILNLEVPLDIRI